MSIKKSLINVMVKGVNRASEIAGLNGRGRHDVDLVIMRSLEKRNGKGDLRFPLDYINLLRDCLERKKLEIKTIKAESGAKNDVFANRFDSLLDALRDLPAIEFSTAEEIAWIADAYRGNLEPIELDRWAGDVRSHFEMSSSFGTKGRILSAIVRFTQARQCLELGTAYGMSAVFILEALRSRGKDIHLATLEALEPQFSMASKMLRSRYGNQVSCEFGWTQEALPKMVKSLGRLDFLFHDAGHAKENYIRDFHTVLPIAVPGAVILMDDIRWEDSRFSRDNPRCYEGWLEIVNHPRVRRAVEISGSIGLLLLGQ